MVRSCGPPGCGVVVAGSPLSSADRGWNGHSSPAVSGEGRGYRKVCTGRQSTGQKRSIGYREADIDPSYLLEIARRASGVSQAELARRAGTSQATVSAYERGLKTPSLAVAARLLGAMGWELTLGRGSSSPSTTPTAWWCLGAEPVVAVPTPDCFATLHVPDLLGHTEQNEWRLGNLTHRLRVYEILIRRGMPQMMVRWLDGGFLVDLWDDLDLPEPVRDAWEPAIRDATRPHSQRHLLLDLGGGPRDRAAGHGSGTGVPAETPYRSPPPPRRSRFDPRP